MNISCAYCKGPLTQGQIYGSQDMSQEELRSLVPSPQEEAA
jgi:hypothetical protein